ncbi:DNA-methyltransferase [Leptolyngbya ohadii]|uniref:DNA-methyltransferase n=1 Tax=Leptolyngbya ohadii TaxID=1962290 RepID=UPI000B59FD47|nr:DNA methyltransferase [Leptolyngbya ohadii]
MTGKDEQTYSHFSSPIFPQTSPQIPPRNRAPRNRTIELTEADRLSLRDRVTQTLPAHPLTELPSGIIHGDSLQIAPLLPQNSVDLLILDPPYNLSKEFDGYRFSRQTIDEYSAWLDRVIVTLKPLLKETATIYICGDWLTSISIFTIASTHFTVRNRITWEREKGRGAKSNWKNASEDIWFCTMSDRYTFNVDAVKLRRKVVAPYRNEQGLPKDWTTTQNGNYRDTHPSNLWTDITIPFWSMPENTDHPTQKSEKLIAKLILASSNPGDRVLDPFLGSGTTTAVCQKLDRMGLGIELSEEYCLLAAKRLELAAQDKTIQGWADGVFWERNTFASQKLTSESSEQPSESSSE